MPATPHIEQHFTGVNRLRAALQTLIVGGRAGTAAFGLALGRACRTILAIPRILADKNAPSVRSA